MREGQIVYQGPPMEAKQHFESIGFKCPTHCDVADFLIQVPYIVGLYVEKELLFLILLLYSTCHPTFTGHWPESLQAPSIPK